MGKKNKKTSKADFNRGLMSKFYGPGAEAQEMLKRYGVAVELVVRDADQQLWEHFGRRGNNPSVRSVGPGLHGLSIIFAERSFACGCWFCAACM